MSTFKEDGHTFIRTATQSLLQSNHRALFPPKPSRTPTSSPPKPSSFLSQPKTFAHFIMNLPATATTFLPSFIGLYADHEPLFHPHTATKLPFIHLYCFSTKSENNKAEEVKICGEISEQLNYKIRPEDEDVTIVGVRDVAPQKRMFCATFRLPREVAFRKGRG